MTIPLTTSPGGLFVRLGKVGKFVHDINVQQNTTWSTDADAIVNQYVNITGPVLPHDEIVGILQTNKQALQLGIGGIGGTIQQIARQTVLAMVLDDNPQFNNSDITLALKELIRQMVANSQSVQRMSLTDSYVARSGNVGNGIVGVSLKDGAGLLLENLFAEAITLLCTQDSFSGGATAGQENFKITGQAAASQTGSWLWPAGSGASSTQSCFRGSANNTAANLLVNGELDAWTGSIPNNWVVTAGGGQIVKNTTSPFSGTANMKIIGDGIASPGIRQQFANSSGTTASLGSGKVYLFGGWIKVDAVPAAGVLTISLVDGSGTILQDPQGVNQVSTINLHSLTTAWTPITADFRLPALPPSTINIKVAVTTPISSGTNLFVDRLALGLGKQMYSGGPFIGVFSGPTAFLLNDAFTLTMGNDRGGSSYATTFQALFDRLFNMKALGLLLPSAASPTISDSLLS